MSLTHSKITLLLEGSVKIYYCFYIKRSQNSGLFPGFYFKMNPFKTITVLRIICRTIEETMLLDFIVIPQ